MNRQQKLIIVISMVAAFMIALGVLFAGSDGEGAVNVAVRDEDAPLTSTSTPPSSSVAIVTPETTSPATTSTTSTTGEMPFATDGMQSSESSTTSSSTTSTSVDHEGSVVVALPSYSSTGTMASAAYERLILRGDIEVDGGCVWVENKNGERLSIRWPEGFQARFDTDAEGEATIELLDPDGVIVASGGDSDLRKSRRVAMSRS